MHVMSAAQVIAWPTCGKGLLSFLLAGLGASRMRVHSCYSADCDAAQQRYLAAESLACSHSCCMPAAVLRSPCVQSPSHSLCPSQGAAVTVRVRISHTLPPTRDLDPPAEAAMSCWVASAQSSHPDRGLLYEWIKWLPNEPQHGTVVETEASLQVDTMTAQAAPPLQQLASQHASPKPAYEALQPCLTGLAPPCDELPELPFLPELQLQVCLHPAWQSCREQAKDHALPCCQAAPEAAEVIDRVQGPPASALSSVRMPAVLDPACLCQVGLPF